MEILFYDYFGIVRLVSNGYCYDVVIKKKKAEKIMAFIKSDEKTFKIKKNTWLNKTPCGELLEIKAIVGDYRNVDIFHDYVNVNDLQKRLELVR